MNPLLNRTTLSHMVVQTRVVQGANFPTQTTGHTRLKTRCLIMEPKYQTKAFNSDCSMYCVHAPQFVFKFFIALEWSAISVLSTRAAS
jgi:hypothetical protein